jgi:hypothetical protein
VASHTHPSPDQWLVLSLSQTTHRVNSYMHVRVVRRTIAPLALLSQCQKSLYCSVHIFVPTDLTADLLLPASCLPADLCTYQLCTCVYPGCNIETQYSVGSP